MTMAINYTNYPGILKSNRVDKTLAFAENIAFDEKNTLGGDNNLKAIITNLQNQINELNNLLKLKE